MTKYNFARMAEESGVPEEVLRRHIPDYEEGDLVSLSRAIRDTCQITTECLAELIKKVLLLADKKQETVKTADEASKLFFLLPAEDLFTDLPGELLKAYSHLVPKILGTWLGKCTSLTELKALHKTMRALGEDYCHFKVLVLNKWQEVFEESLEKADTAEKITKIIQDAPPEGNGTATAIEKLSQFYRIETTEA